MQRKRREIWLAALTAAVLQLGCGEDATVQVTIIDRDTGEPVPGALLSVEVGGIYVKNEDTSEGSPAYQYGGRADADGRLSVVVPAGDVGFHTFAAGYRYGREGKTVEGESSLEIKMSPQLPEDVPPTLSQVEISPSTVGGGEELTVTAFVEASSPDDPLSDETLVIVEGENFSVAMDPPSPGEQGVGYPDGMYKKTFSAPSEPGTYTVTVVTTSELCVTSAPVDLELIVE